MDNNESQPVSTGTDSLKTQTSPQDENQDSQPTITESTSTESQDSQSVTTKSITNETPTTTPPANPKKSHKKLIIVIAIILAALSLGGVACALVLNQNNTNNDPKDQSSNNTIPDQITNFDLAFLENKEANQLYSPLSIKYALGMLEAGAAGNSQKQIESAIKPLTPEKYPNNANMSFANGLFINNKLPDDEIKNSYIETISERFGAETLRIPFTSATPINNWVSDKTFGLIKDLVTDEMLQPVGAPEQYFALVNALAIDMEWINKIQPYDKDYSISFRHINYSSSITPFNLIGFTKQPFNDSAIDVKALRLAATIHKYDILNDLGVDNIRQTIIDKYSDWLNSEEGIYCAKYEKEPFPAPEVYVEQYLEELGNGGYETISSSTDFLMHDDDEVKVFAKDLQTYDGITLQYVGIMPKETSLKDYVQDLTTDQLAKTISQLKPLTLENFKDGVVTNIIANIPVFKFEDKLNLLDKLEGMGITDVFSETEADLSNLAENSEGLYIGQAMHQTTIDFSNDGIKASAATVLDGGKGAGGCSFYYDFDVPIETIDLTFDNPYLFLIRDKDSGTIWFVGTVYEPTIYAN